MHENKIEIYGHFFVLSFRPGVHFLNGTPGSRLPSLVDLVQTCEGQKPTHPHTRCRCGGVRALEDCCRTLCLSPASPVLTTLGWESLLVCGSVVVCVRSTTRGARFGRILRSKRRWYVCVTLRMWFSSLSVCAVRVVV